MKTEAVIAVVRVRPLNKKEKKEKSKNCIKVDNEQSLQIKDLKNPSQDRRFTFDKVFTQNQTQKEIYQNCAFSIVEKVFEGYNGTIFAYGQTGCGKTFTMIGDESNSELMGIIPRVFTHCRSIICNEKNKEFLLQASYLEIYNECVFDLLNKDRVKLELKSSKKDGVYVKDLKKVDVKTLQSMNEVMLFGNKNRTVGETAMNSGSSRSHSIFTIYIETAENVENKKKYSYSKLSLVDLAGSEKTKKTKATGQRLKEGTKINLSLSSLGNVIKALVDGKAKHIPYRDSKLTRLFKNTFTRFIRR